MKAVKAFLDWAEKREGQSLLYRGLAYAGWEVESAAYRRIKKPGGPQLFPEEISGVFKNYISQLLEKASMRNFRAHEGNELSDLKLLARLQHYGAATCLIDFTQNPLVALWFACQEQLKDGAEQDGKVIVMDTGADATISDFGPSVQMQRAFNKVGPEQLEFKDRIGELLGGETMWKWEPTPRESRVIAQQSVFVFGPAVIENPYYEEVHVPAPAKEGILHMLDKKFGINQASLFGDFAGFVLANAHDKSYEEYNADDYYEFADSLFISRDGEEKAMRYCDKAIEKDSRHVKAHHLRGICNYYLKKPMESIKDFSRAIEADPTHVPSLLQRAGIYVNDQGNPKEAIADYNKCIALMSSSEHKEHRELVSAYIYRGNAYMMLKNHREAEGDFTKAIEFASSSEHKSLSSRLQAAYQRRGHVRAAMGSHQNAIEDFTSAIEIRPRVALYRERSKSYRALGNEKAAQADEKAAQADEKEAKKIMQNMRRRFMRKR